MVWVSRDASNAVNGVYANRQEGYAEEHLDNDDAAVVAFLKPRAPPDPIDTWDIVSLKIAFAHENRIRALEGKAAITLQQFKTAVKALL